MKKLYFETSKGKFLLSESDEHYDHRFICQLSKITEQQASEIVDNGNIDSIEVLKLLLHKKGVHLFGNPFPDAGLIPSAEQQLYREAKQNTFYNPYIFKL